MLITVANAFGVKMAMIVTDITYSPAIIILTVLAIISTIKFGIKSYQGKAWLFFVLGAMSWAVAEHLWTIIDLVYEADTFPSIADFFYLGGYPFIFLFCIYYLKPVKNAISRKIIILAISLSVAITIPGIYFAYQPYPDIPLFEVVLATSYPIVDAIILVPALIGLILFFNGKVNFLWTLMCIGIIVLAAADTGFLVTEFDDSYYTGHPVDILFVWTYVLFSYGVYDHIRIFRDRVIPKNNYQKNEDLR